MPERSPLHLEPHGENTPLALAADDGLREAVDKWYRNAFGVAIDVVGVGGYFELHVRAHTRGANVRLVQSGRGLSHVLPVAVTALTAANSGPGVDIIEHPEAELHPAAHADVAELLLGSLAGRARPMIIETHSEMLLLRARGAGSRKGACRPQDVLVYWVDVGARSAVPLFARSGSMSTVKWISWPDGVFIEDYDEILAIRRANRSKA